jgi:hypothetical protein
MADAFPKNLVEFVKKFATGGGAYRVSHGRTMARGFRLPDVRHEEGLDLELPQRLGQPRRVRVPRKRTPSVV